jgi:hypothetical protein
MQRRRPSRSRGSFCPWTSAATASSGDPSPPASTLCAQPPLAGPVVHGHNWKPEKKEHDYDDDTCCGNAKTCKNTNLEQSKSDASASDTVDSWIVEKGAGEKRREQNEKIVREG